MNVYECLFHKRPVPARGVCTELLPTQILFLSLSLLLAKFKRDKLKKYLKLGYVQIYSKP